MKPNPDIAQLMASLPEIVAALRRLEARAESVRHAKTMETWAALPCLVSGSVFRDFTGLNHDDFRAFITQGRIHEAPVPPPRERSKCESATPKFYKLEMLAFILPPAEYAAVLLHFADLCKSSQTVPRPLTPPRGQPLVHA